MPNTDRSVIPAEVNNVYNRSLLDKAVPNFIHTLFSQVRDIDPKSGTDTVKFRRYGVLAANVTPLTEGVTPAGKQLSVTDLTAAIAWYGDFITFTDEVEIETADPFLIETAEVLGIQAGDSVDQIARDVFAAGTTVQYASTATQRDAITSVMKINRSEVLEAEMTLANNNARPISSMIDASTGFNTQAISKGYIGLAKPATIRVLKDEPGWVPVKDYADPSKALPYEKGTLDETRFLESTNCKVFTGLGSGGIDVYGTLIMAENATGISRIAGHTLTNIVKPVGSSGSLDPLNQRGSSGWKLSFVAKILNQTWMVRIEHA